MTSLRATQRAVPLGRAFGRSALFLGLLAGTSVLSGFGSATAFVPAASTSYLYSGFGTKGVALLTPSSVTALADAVTTVPPCPKTGTCRYSAIANDIVAAGYEGTAAGGQDFAVAVENPVNGQEVAAFNGGSLLTTHFSFGSGSSVRATAVAVYPPCPSTEPSCPWASEAGDIVVAGTAAAGGAAQTNAEVAAFSPSGSEVWATAFAPAGSGTVDLVSALALDTKGAAPHGDVIVAGGAPVTVGGGEQPLLAAFSPSGAVDGAFGSGGLDTSFIDPITGTDPSFEYLGGVAVDGLGNIVADGTFYDNGGNPTIVIGRFTSTGAPDMTFGLPANCAGSATCSGATQVGSGDLGGQLALEFQSGSCPGQPGCYDVLVAGTGSPNSPPSSVVVAAVDETGKVITFGGASGGVVTAERPSSGATATGIAVQRVNGVNTGILVSGYIAGTASSNGTATVTRLTPTGSVVTTFGSNGSYTIPSRSGLALPPAQALDVAALPNTLDFVTVGALLGSTDINSRFGVARLIGELVTVTAKVVKYPVRLNLDRITITATASAPPPLNLTVSWSLAASPAGITFGSSKGSIVIKAGQTVGTTNTVAYFPPLIGNGTVFVTSSSSIGGGFSAVTSPPVVSAPALSPFGPAPPPGYWMITSTGGVYAFQVPFKGALAHLPPSPIIGLAESPYGSGYWLATAAGGIYSFGVKFQGALSKAPASPIVAIACDPSTGGYWLFGRGGAVYSFGAGTPYYGGLQKLSSPVVAAGAAPDGLGYWMVTANGSVYGFGPGAKYQGGVSNPPAPIAAMAPDLHTGGYWLVTTNGHVYGFNAPYKGSATGQHATSIAPDPYTSGYWVALANGGVYSFGAKFYGSAANYHPHGAVVTILGR